MAVVETATKKTKKRLDLEEHHGRCIEKGSCS